MKNKRLNFILIGVLMVFSTIQAQEMETIDNKGTIKTVTSNSVTTATTEPSSPVKDDVWIDTTANIIKIWDGTVWIPLNVVTTAMVAPTSPVSGDVWIDSSGTPNSAKIYDGITWIEIAVESEPWLDVASPGEGATTATTNLYLDTGKSITVGTATPTAGKVATFAGDVDIQGVLDPTKLIFSDGTTTSFDPAINNAYEIEFDTRALRFTNSTAEDNLVILQNGNVGIGTTTPGVNLDVDVTSNAGVDAIIRARSSGNVSRMLLSNTGTLGRVWSLSAYKDTFIPNGGFVIADETATMDRFSIDPLGNIGIGTTTQDASAKLHIASTTSGFVMPRMSTAQRVAIVSPIAGLEVYDITTNSHWYHDGTNWIENATGTGDFTNDEWVNNPGAARIELGMQSDGTTARTAGTEFVALDNGNVGIGTTNPTERLEIDGNISMFSTGGAGTSRTITTPARELVFEETGDVFGTVSLRLQNRGGSNGAVFENSSIDLVDFRFNPSSNVAQNIRYEHRPGEVHPGNATGQFEIGFPGNETLFVGQGASGFRIGNVGIGTTTPNARLTFSNNAGTDFLDNYSEYQILLFDGGTSSSSYGIGIKAGHTVFNSNGGYSFDRAGSVTSMLINTAGNVGIGTTAPTARLSVNGTANKAGGGHWAVFSDARSKENVKNYIKGLDELLQLRPVSFNYKKEFDFGSKTYVGLIAQELEKVMPSMVREIEIKHLKDFREVDSNEITYMLINAVKELKEKIESLENENAQLKALVTKTNDLKERLTFIEKALHIQNTNNTTVHKK